MTKKPSLLKKHPDWKEYIPHIAYDSVVFGFSGEKLKILVMEYHNTGLFALPGGFVLNAENLNDAVRRGLKERTGISNIYLEQCYVFGDRNRHRPEVMEKILLANGMDLKKNSRLLERYISVAYFALINYKKVKPKPDALSDSCEWYDIDDLPKLILDHKEIVQKALSVLKKNLDEQIIGSNLLPDKFTMRELQLVYEAILGESLHRTNFQRKMLSSGLLIRHAKQYSGKAHKAPYLYNFISEKKSKS